jgi:hypothetical protein
MGFPHFLDMAAMAPSNSSWPGDEGGVVGGRS